MEQRNSPQVGRVEWSLSSFQATSSTYSELRLFVSVAWTANRRTEQLSREVVRLAPPHLLCQPEVATELIYQMLSTINIDPSIRIHLEPVRQRISTFACRSCWRSPTGLIKMAAEIKIYVNAPPRWIRSGGWRSEEEEEAAAVDQALMVSFDEVGSRGVPATKSAIKKLDKLIYGTAGEEGCRETDCVICMEDFKAGAEVSKMPCSHAFHQMCLEKWLEQSHQCPLCRFALPAQMDQ